MRTGKNTQTDAIHILFNRRLHDAFRSLAQAGIEYFHSSIAERARDDFGAAVVAVEASLGYQYADGASGWRFSLHSAER